MELLMCSLSEFQFQKRVYLWVNNGNWKNGFWEKRNMLKIDEQYRTDVNYDQWTTHLKKYLCCILDVWFIGPLSSTLILIIPIIIPLQPITSAHISFRNHIAKPSKCLGWMKPNRNGLQDFNLFKCVDFCASFDSKNSPYSTTWSKYDGEIN